MAFTLTYMPPFSSAATFLPCFTDNDFEKNMDPVPLLTSPATYIHICVDILFLLCDHHDDMKNRLHTIVTFYTVLQVNSEIFK